MGLNESLLSFGASFLFYLIARATGGEAQRVKNTKQVSSFEELDKLIGVLPQVLALRGIVGCQEPLSAEHAVSGVVGAVIRTVVTRHFMRRTSGGLGGDWASDCREVSSSTIEAPWFIEDKAGGNGKAVWVLGAKELVSLTKVSDVMEKSHVLHNLIETSLNYLHGFKNLGLQYTEHMLPLGTELTVIGEVSQADGRGWIVTRPSSGQRFYVTSKSARELVYELGERARMCRAVSLGLAVLGGALLLALGCRSLTHRLRLSRLKRNHYSAAGASGEGHRGQNHPTQDSGNSKLDQMCVVCWMEPLGAIFKDCGHLCCCISCAKKLPQCPICRKKSEVIRVFTP